MAVLTVAWLEVRVGGCCGSDVGDDVGHGSVGGAVTQMVDK